MVLYKSCPLIHTSANLYSKVVKLLYAALLYLRGEMHVIDSE